MWHCPSLTQMLCFYLLIIFFPISIMQKIIKECKQRRVTPCDHITSQMKCWQSKFKTYVSPRWMNHYTPCWCFNVWKMKLILSNAKQVLQSQINTIRINVYPMCIDLVGLDGGLSLVYYGYCILTHNVQLTLSKVLIGIGTSTMHMEGNLK
jgi:hypothetical protein